MSVEYGYVADSKRGKKKKENKFTDPHDLKMLEKVQEKIKLPNQAWSEMRRDFESGFGKKRICAKYGINSGYYKYLKNIIGV